jgi:Zn-finger nucleic acid-binding protein
MVPVAAIDPWYDSAMARADDPRQLPHDPKPDNRLRCPKDGTIMERVPIGSFIVERCAACGAMWFDAHELDRVLEDKSAIKDLDVGPLGERQAARLPEALGGRHCPRDKSAMIDFHHQKQAHVELLACTVCGGILVDAGELKDLSEYTLRERLRNLIGR